MSAVIVFNCQLLEGRLHFQTNTRLWYFTIPTTDVQHFFAKYLLILDNEIQI
jgi:hypothetical protein